MAAAFGGKGLPRLFIGAVAVAVAGAIAIVVFTGGSAEREDPPARNARDRIAEQRPPDTTVPVTDPAAVEPAPTGRTARPMEGQSAVIAIDRQQRRITVETWPDVVTYAMCSDFSARSAAGSDLNLSELRPGDFGIVDVDASKACLRTVALTPPPSPEECGDSGMPGYAEVTWNGFNTRAKSVLFTPTGSDQRTRATRWCNAPVVIGADGAAITMAQIRKGATVRLIEGDVWLKSIEVVSP